MSRSTKKAIIKMPGPNKDNYHKNSRRAIKMAVKAQKEIIPNSKEIINDYDYMDYISNCENSTDCYCIRKYGFKKCKKK